MSIDVQTDNLQGTYYVEDGMLKKFVGLDKKIYDISVNGNKPTSGFLRYDNYMTTGYLIIDEYKIDIQDNKVIETNKYNGTLSNILAISACNSQIYNNGTIDKEEYNFACGEFINENIYTYTENADGTITITGLKDGVTDTDIVKNGIWAIPSEIDNKTVTAIGSRAFEIKNIQADVIIPNGVTSIGYRAFANNKLTSVEIPNSVTSIGSAAFYGNQIMSVEISASVLSIESAAFYGNQIMSVEISASVLSIGNCAFYNNQIKSVKIPDSFTSIGEEAFASNQLTSIEIPKDTPKSAFQSNPLKTIIFKEGWENIPDEYACNKGYNLTSITLPTSLKTIGSLAFAGNRLISIEIPDNVTSVDMAAFAGNQLKSLILGKNLTSVHISSFGSALLTTIYDNSDSQIFVNEYQNNNSLSNFGLSQFNSDNTSVFLYDKSGNIVNINN